MRPPNLDTLASSLSLIVINLPSATSEIPIPKISPLAPIASTSSLSPPTESIPPSVKLQNPINPISPSSTTPPIIPPPTNAQILLDFVGRISKLDSRIKSYTLSRLSSAVSPITAFLPRAGALSGTATPMSGSKSNTGMGGEERFGFGNYGFSCSLVDVERFVLGKAWKGKEKDQNDGQGLDIDLSELGIFDLVGGSREEVGQNDVLAENVIQKGETKDQMPASIKPGLFLNYYSSEDLVKLLESTGVLAALVKKGYTSSSLIFDTSDPYQHRLSLIDASLFTESNSLNSSDRFLIDLYMKRRREWDLSMIVSYQLLKRLVKAGSWSKLREMTGEIRAPFVGLEGAKESILFFEKEIAKAAAISKKGNGFLDLSEIAWLEMRDPLSTSTRDKLPGQRFPGLGLSKEVSLVMEKMVISSKVTDGLLNFPFHFHQSISYGLRGYKHIDPIFEAYVHWMYSELAEVIQEHGLNFVAWCVTLGFCRRITEVEKEIGTWMVVSSPVEIWSPAEQIFAASEAMSSFFASAEYSRLYSKYYDIFELDGGAMLEGVDMIDEVDTKMKKRARISLAVEECPELWKYSKIWKDRPIPVYEE